MRRESLVQRGYEGVGMMKVEAPCCVCETWE
jgi:hypothetical protein